MSTTTQHNSGSVYRIDKFAVPQAAREKFLAKLDETKVFLDTREGCLQNVVLEHESGSERFNLITIVEWADEAAFEKAKAAMVEARRESGFDPLEFIALLGVEADMANYVAAGAV